MSLECYAIVFVMDAVSIEIHPNQLPATGFDENERYSQIPLWMVSSHLQNGSFSFDGLPAAHASW